MEKEGMEGGEADERPGRLNGPAALLLALVLPALVLSAAGASAAVHYLFPPRPNYGTPPATAEPLMGWDGARNQVVMVGGETGSDDSGATWTWDGTGWVRHAVDVPSWATPQEARTTAYDPALQALVVVVADQHDGGVTTMLWSGTTWKQLGLSGEISIAEPSVGYDEGRAQLVLAGVASAPRGRETLATFVLQGEQWVARPQELEVPDGPMHLAYDHSTHRLLLIPSAPPPPPPPCHPPPPIRGLPQPDECGMILRFPCSAGCAVDPLAWDGQSWAPAHMPARAGIVVADPDGTGLLNVIASADGTRGVWRWNGRRWGRLAGLPLSSAVQGWSVAADRDAHQLVLFGGQQLVSYEPFTQQRSDETWSFDGRAWTRRGGKPLPKPPPPPTPMPPAPPPPCTGAAPDVVTMTTTDGVEVLVQRPVSGPPGSCVAAAVSIAVETASGRLLAISGNPLQIAASAAYPPFQRDSPVALWWNWCGAREGIVIHLRGDGFDLARPAGASPPCTDSRKVSTVTPIIEPSVGGVP